MPWSRVFLVFIAIFLILGSGDCQNSNSSEPKETYVGRLERVVRVLMKSGRQIEQGISTIKEDVRDVVSHLPLLRNRTRSRQTTISDVLNPFKIKIKAIFPGTYWCGDGDISPNKKDLGLFKKTDACCKAHDSCPEGLAAQEKRDGLWNNGIFTRSHCDCDKEFYRCLKEANSIIASDIGTTYFNVLRPQCFRKSYPIEGCKKYAGRLINDKCVEYNYNSTQPQIYQWFDNPDFVRL